MAVRRDARGRWAVEFTAPQPSGKKKRVTKASASWTQAEAQLWEAQTRIQVIQGTYKPQKKEVDQPTAQLTVRQFSATFMDQHATASNRPSEHESKTGWLNKYILPELGHLPLGAVKARDVERFKLTLAKAKLAPKTRNNILTVLRKLLAYAVELEEIEAAPRIKLVKVEQGAAQKIEWLERDQLEQLLAGQDDAQVQLAILLGAEAGLRRGEMAALRWADVDTRRGQLTVCRTLCFRSGEELSPKGKRSRVVPMTKRLAAALAAHRHLCPTVLKRPDGSQWTKEVFRYAGHQMYEDAAQTKPSKPWHCLRHSFCSHLALAGAPVISIMQLAGHTDLATTQRYMHLSPTARREAIGLLEQTGR